MNKTKQEAYRQRNKEIYKRYIKGESKKAIALAFSLSVSQVTFILGREMNKNHNS